MESLADFLRLEGIQVNEPPREDPRGEELLDLTGAEFFRAVVGSREYRESLWRRIKLDALPPAVECRMLDHALGKPVEHVEVKDTTNIFSGLTTRQLRERLLLIAQNLPDEAGPKETLH